MVTQNHQTVHTVHDILHIMLLLGQLIGVVWIGVIANQIQAQNYEIQKMLYDFDPQIHGLVSDIWVHGYKNETVADVEILIIAPHAGNFTLHINNMYLFEQYLDPSLRWLNRITMLESIRDVTYPQAYKYRASVKLEAVIFVNPELILRYTHFKVGVLEFNLVYYDVPENALYNKLLNGTVWFEFT